MNSTALAAVLDEQSVRATGTTLLSPEQTSKYLLLSTSTLARMRIAGNGPVFVRTSPQRVSYRLRDLEKFVEERLRTSTSQS